MGSKPPVPLYKPTLEEIESKALEYGHDKHIVKSVLEQIYSTQDREVLASTMNDEIKKLEYLISGLLDTLLPEYHRVYSILTRKA